VEVALQRRASAEDGPRGGATKRIKVNDAARQVADLAGLAPVVLFLVDDLEIIRGDPATRRAFLDTDLADTSRTYAWALRQYTRVLEHRNRVLRDIRESGKDTADLLPWTMQLAAYGGRLLEVRTRFVADLSAAAGPTYGALTDSDQAMAVEYVRNWGDPEARPTTRDAFAALLAETLDAAVDEETRRGSTVAGPHRDDLRILVDGRDLRAFGSQGEQRTAALALRVAEFALLKTLLGEPPVLLLDDILSELDRTRRAALLAHLAPVAQVILTTTDVDAIGLPDRGDVQQYRVSDGVVEVL
jgi:DNA replication and repair protein RecF